jgi:hypothetical protein
MDSLRVEAGVMVMVVMMMMVIIHLRLRRIRNCEAED